MPLSFQRRIKFAPKPEKILEEFNFDGGLFTDAHETKPKSNQSPDLANVVFNDSGSIKTRNGYLRYNTTPVGAASDQANTGASAGTVEIDDTTDQVAQTFQPSGAISVVQVDLYLAMQTANEEQYVQVQLWSTSGGAPSAILTNGTGQIKLVSGTSETAYNFRFRQPVSLSAATTYAIVLKPFIRGSTQAVNDVLVHRTGAAYANGQVYTSVDTGLNWSAAGNDLKFVVYGGGDTGCTGLLRYYNSSSVKQLIAKFGTSLYRGNDVSGAMTAITLGSGVSLTAANFIDWTVVNDTLLLVDGTNKIQKYRGSTNANYTTGTVSVTNGSTTVTGSGTTWTTSTNAETGEYIKLPDGKWYKITVITDNTHLTIERSYQGSDSSGQSYTISPWGEVQGKLNTATLPASLVRPTPQYIASHINRVWTLEDNALRFSALDTSITEEHFNDWDTANNAGQINIVADKGDTGTGLYSINGKLCVFQKHSIWVLLGSSPANFELRNVSNEIGLSDRRTLIEYDAYLIFFSGKDIYLFDGTNLRNLTSNRIHNLIAEWSNTTSLSATLWDNRYVLSYTPSGGSANSQAIFYDIPRDIFGKLEDVYASAWSVWDGGNDTGQVYFGSSNQGSIYRWDTGGHDDGYQITTRYNTPSLGLNANMNDKIVKKVYLQQIALGDWNMTVNQYSNITAETTSSSVNLSTGTGALWDVAQWDVDEWPDESSLITTRITEFQGTAKYFKYEFSQTGYNEGVEILGLNITARTRRLQ